MSGRWCRLLPVHVRVEIGMHVRQQEAVAVLEVQALAHEHGNRALDRRSCTHSRLLLLSADKRHVWEHRFGSRLFASPCEMSELITPAQITPMALTHPLSSRWK